MSYLKFFSYKNYLPFYLLVILLLNFLLLSIPLLNVFGYEFSVFNSVLLTFISGFYVISLSKKKEYQNFNLKLIASSFFFLLIPFLVSVINSFFTGFCSFSDGVMFYFVITAPSLIIGYALGLTTVLFLKKIKRFFFFLIIILILLIPLAEFYFNPQVYFYNPVLGYLPGTIYDEGLSVDLKLILYRSLNLLFFGVLLVTLVLKLKGKIRTGKIYFLLYLLIIPALFIYSSPDFGFSTSFKKLKEKLHNKVSTEHYDIFFDERIPDKFVKLIVFHHGYYYKELEEYLKVIPSQKIKSFIFYNNEQKKNLFGSANADVAKPWLYSLFITYDNYKTTLKHEIAHCFSAEFGEGPFKIADMINPFLIEGLASSSAPFYDENDIHYLASVAYKNNYKSGIEEMYEPSGFFTQTSSLSYIYAGSFSKYLIDNYEIEKFKLLYTEPDFQKIYNKSVKELETEFYNYLNEFDTDKEDDKAHYYFGRKSIFYKVCPRFIADRLNVAWNYYYKEEYKNAEETFNYILLRAETYSAVTGLAYTLNKTGRKDSAITLLNNYTDDFVNTSYYYNLLFTLADIYAEADTIGKADSLYQILIEKNPSINILYLSQLRRDLIQNNKIKEYLSGDDKTKYTLLKDLNKKSYNYSSIPVMINISEALDEDYSVFTKQFDKTMFINNFQAAYAAYKLSQYMAENLDFNRARRMAALSLRFKDYNYNKLFNENYRKMNWFYHNYKKISEQMEAQN